jgi:hypothetical protein
MPGRDLGYRMEMQLDYRSRGLLDHSGKRPRCTGDQDAERNQER